MAEYATECNYDVEVMRALANGHLHEEAICSYVSLWRPGVQKILAGLQARGRVRCDNGEWALEPHPDVPVAILVDHWSFGRQHCRRDLQYVADRWGEDPSVSWEQLCSETGNFGFDSPDIAIENRIPYFFFTTLKDKEPSK